MAPMPLYQYHLTDIFNLVTHSWFWEMWSILQIECLRTEKEFSFFSLCDFFFNPCGLAKWSWFSPLTLSCPISWWFLGLSAHQNCPDRFFKTEDHHPGLTLRFWSPWSVFGAQDLHILKALQVILNAWSGLKSTGPKSRPFEGHVKTWANQREP